MTHPEIQHAWAKKLVEEKDYTDTRFLLGELKRIQSQDLLRNQNIRSTGDVYVVQHALRALGQDIPRVRDAIFRSKKQRQSGVRSETMEAISLFQKQHHLTDDGQVGPQTIEKMVQVMEQHIEGRSTAEQPPVVDRRISQAPVVEYESVLAEDIGYWKNQLGPGLTWEGVMENKHPEIVANTQILFYMRLRKDGDAGSQSYVVIEDTLYHWNTHENAWEVAPDLEIRNGKIARKLSSSVGEEGSSKEKVQDVKRESDVGIEGGDSPPLMENPVIADAMNQKKSDQTKETAERSIRIESIVKDFMDATTLPFESGGESVALDMGSGKLSIGEEVYVFPKPSITPTVSLENDTITFKVKYFNTSIQKNEIPLRDILRLEPRTSGTFMIRGKNFRIEREK